MCDPQYYSIAVIEDSSPDELSSSSRWYNALLAYHCITVL